MILYHGTNIDFKEIDLEKSKPYKDFGQGFYLTTIKEQAEKMAVKKSSIFGGKAIIQEYEISDDFLTNANINVKIFETPNKEWAEFIYKNRSKKKDSYKHNYDIVIGPIADDGVAYLLGRYDEHTITIEELVEQLKYKKLSNQYFFGTTKALALLNRIK